MKIQEGQVAVVTGGASGIGLALAEELGARGVRIAIADIRETALTEATAHLVARGIEVGAWHTDVSDYESVQALAAGTIAAFGRVDLVFNNAGVVGPQARMWEQPQSAWEKLIAVKLVGVVNGVRAFAPLLIERGAGRIINTASSGGLIPLPGMTPYNGTMHAVVGMTETLDLELRAISEDLGATVLCPGVVATDLGANSVDLGTAPPLTAAVQARSDEQLVAHYGAALSSNEVALATLQAIESNRVHAIIGPGILAQVRERLESVARDIGG